MREMFLDVIRHIDSLGCFDYAKFTASDDDTKFEAMDDERTIFLKGVLKQPCLDLKGQFGMKSLSILQGFLNFPSYRTEIANVSVNQRLTDNGVVSEEIVFEGDSGQKSVYRLMLASLIPEQGKFIGVGWNIDISPTRDKLLEFLQLSSILSSFEKWFLATTQNGHLKFFLGDEDATTHRSVVTMQENVDGELKGDLYFHTPTISSVLKLGLDENMRLKLSNKGAMSIEMNTPIAEYNFILPSRHR